MDEKQIYLKVANKTLSIDEALQMLMSKKKIPKIKNAIFKNKLSNNNLYVKYFKHNEPYLKDHTVYDSQVLLGITYGCMAIEAAKANLAKERMISIQNLYFNQPVVLEKNESVQINIEIESTENKSFKVKYQKNSTDKIETTASGKYSFTENEPTQQFNISKFINHANTSVLGWVVYNYMQQHPVSYGKSLKTIKKVHYSNHEVLGELMLTNEMSNQFINYDVHPAIVDAAILCGVFDILKDKAEPFIPIMIKSMQMYKPTKKHCFCHIYNIKTNDEIISLNINIYDENGSILLKMKEIICKRVRTKVDFLKLQKSNNESISTVSSPYDVNCEIINVNKSPNILSDQIIYYLSNKICLLLKGNVKHIDKFCNFMNLGLDSNDLIQYTHILSKELSIELSPTIFFEYQNIHELANYLFLEHQDAFQAYLKENANSDSFKINERQEITEKNVNKSALTNDKHIVDDPIVIVGMAGIFPKSDDLTEFWQHLTNGDDLISEIPEDRWDWKLFYGDPLHEKNKSYSKWGGFINNVDRFDAAFFNIKPNEAELMDPKQRIFLEIVWKTIEDAGYQAQELKGSKTGVFIGIGALEYGSFMMNTNNNIEAYSATGLANSIIPNRISYMMDFHGPSEPVDTACSSSLVAIHRAIQAIKAGDCVQAIVGGVNLMLSPYLHIAFSRAGMLSKVGRCKTFDKAADGYVRGEGAAALLLKPLSAAVAAHDHIYAIIKTTAINHGGSANSLTAPNTKLQTELLVEAYTKANIDPTTISYIETHGTGTELGDPVEIKALKNAFQQLSKTSSDVVGSSPYCGLGSVKTNIGHLEAAAGIASIIKVLLALKYKKLPSTVHFDELNPYIQLENTPFYIINKTNTWNSFITENNQIIPRRAGISSFGFGGVNAHIILEEYTAATDEILAKSSEPFIFVLSAKNGSTLKRYAEKMLLKLQQEHDSPLLDIIHTLQNGREPMPIRLAIVANNKQDLIRRLMAFCDKTKTIEHDIYHNMEQPSADTAIKLQDNEIDELVRKHLSNGNNVEIAKLWVSGININWQKSYYTKSYNRISLPTYPFGGDRYWNYEYTKSNSQALAPMLDSAEIPSQEHEAKYVKRFTGDDLIFKDHVVGNRKVFPGAGHIELACQAFNNYNKKRSFKLNNIYFQNILSIKNELDLYIEINRNNDTLNYRIFSELDGLQLSHSVGEYSSDHDQLNNCIINNIDINAIKQRCILKIDQQTLYKQFNSAGIIYGSSLQSLHYILMNNQEALGFVELPDNLIDEFDQYLLHPCLLDGVFQVILGFLANQNDDRPKKMLPFAIEQVELIYPIEKQIFAYITKIKDQQFDIAILNAEGLLLAKIRNIFAREEKNNTVENSMYMPNWQNVTYQLNDANLANKNGLLILHPKECNSLVSQIDQVVAEKFSDIQKIIIHDQSLSNESTEITSILTTYNSLDTIYWLATTDFEEDSNVDLERFCSIANQGLVQLFEFIKNIDRHGLLSRQLTIFIITNSLYSILPDDKIKPHYAGMVGFIKSISKEYPNIHCKLLDINTSSKMLTPDDLKILQKALLMSSGDSQIDLAIRNGNLYQKNLVPVQLPMANKSIFREGGVYLIVGGAGGIGLELGLYLAKTVHARIVLLGRNPLDKQQQQKIDLIKTMGGEVLYIQANVADLISTTKAIKQAKATFGSINGVIHSAVVLNDMLINKMSKNILLSVLEPKVTGSVTLAKAFENEPLDFMLFFSSALSCAGNTGQSNYAAACSFEDNFSLFLNQIKSYPVKVINWGFWGQVGVVSSANYNEHLQTQGFQSISIDEGMMAIEIILGSTLNQAIVIKAEDHVLQTMGVNQTNSEIVNEIQSYINSIPKQDILNIANTFKVFEQYVQYALFNTLRQIGIFNNKDEKINFEYLISKLKVIPQYERLVKALLFILEKATFLIEHTAGLYLPSKEIINESTESLSHQLQTLKTRLLNQLPEIEPYIKLVDVCLVNYPAILSGKKNYVDIMFPNASISLVEKIYSNNIYSDYFNIIVAEITKLHLKTINDQSPHEKIKILEVGAGTGGTTDFVLDAVKEYSQKISYIYSDVSIGFLRVAQQKYGDNYPFIKYQVIDLEAPYIVYDIAENSLDIILGSNVLHATKNVYQTLCNLKRMLKKNALLIINESTQTKDFATISFGITTGWWIHNDVSNRQIHSPIISLNTWKKLLERCGFMKIVTFRLPGLTEKDAWQNVIMCESDGVIPIQTETKVESGIVKENAKTGLLSHTLSVGNDSFLLQVEHYIKNTFSKIIRIPKENINSQSTFEAYGIDSLIGIEIRKELEKDLGKLPATLLFDNTSVKSLADYFISNKLDGLTSKLNQPSSFRENEASLNIVPLKEKQQFNSASSQDIAIVGLSGRYPMAENLDEYLLNLRSGKNCISEVPLERWNWQSDHAYDIVKKQQSYYQWGGFIDHVDKFDALFFNISPAEAEEMDPQERIMLELAWQVLEDGGYIRSELLKKPRKAAVFIGAMNHDYEWLSATAIAKGITNKAHSWCWSLANRISYFFNLQGPSMAVDTACSASLTAIHLACQSIRNGESELAIAGGVNLILHPNHLKQLSYGGLLSKNNKTNCFGENADGFVDGEGAGLVLLKTLDQAISDGNIIYGIIKGSAINAGGKTSGYLTPNTNAQADLILQALDGMSISPTSINYIEASAAGSKLGDAIEISALNKVFKKYTADKQICAIGSVKSNIGHLEAASGMAALSKVLLQIQQHELFPSINSDTLNPDCDFNDSPCFVQKELAKWQPITTADGTKSVRRAGISSFGAGGANAHVIIEEYQHEAILNTDQDRPFFIIVISARNKQSLQSYLQNLLKYFSIHHYTNIQLKQIAYTLQVSREALTERIAFIVKSIDELISLINSWLIKRDAHTSDNVLHSNDLNLQQAIDQETYQIANKWVNGEVIDWKLMYAHQTVCLIRLPGYSFAKERYWITEASQPIANKEMLPINKESSTIMSTNDLNENNKIFLKLQADLLTLVSIVLKVNYADLFADDDMSQYGFDSIRIFQFIAMINEKYDLNLLPTIYYNHTSIAEFANTIINTYKTIMVNYYQNQVTSENPNNSCIAAVNSDDNIAVKNTINKQAIAIVGIAGMFPGSPDLEQFWQNLVAGHDMITEVPMQRWSWKSIHTEGSETTKTGLQWGGFIADIDKFDAHFFGISRREACLMDPQHRIFLELVWKAIEDSGYCPLDLWGSKTSLYVGVANTDYMNLLQDTKLEAHTITGNAHSILANRISYLLNLRGPSEPVDTGCSSSLVAVHKAVESIWYGDCQFAIAGGINTLISPDLYLTFENAGMLSPDGKCKTFDESANGYVRGEGAGVVLMMPLQAAIKNKMPIYAVIKSSVINHGGRTSSLTVPNPIAQKELLVEAYQQAQVDPTSITYIETHGTGTKLGDPIEINAMKEAFVELYQNYGKHDQLTKHCGIGALKSNIGHLETAAGIAGLLKVILSMKNKMLPKNIHFNQLNSYIQLEDSPFFIIDENKQWDNLLDDDNNIVPRRAGISSFGFGGVNAHIVLEEYPERPLTNKDNEQELRVIPISAADKNTLHTYISQLHHNLTLTENKNSYSLDDIAYTMQTGRLAMKERVAFIVTSKKELIQGLNNFLNNETKNSNNCFVGTVQDQRKFQGINKENRKATNDNDLNYSKQHIPEIVNKWVTGTNIDWWRFYTTSQLPYKVSLPGYPFSKMEGYWYTQLADIFKTNMNHQYQTVDTNVIAVDATLVSNNAINIPIYEHFNIAIKAILAGILSTNVAEIADDINFVELGLDSIMGMRLVKEIKKSLHISINPKYVFENQTVDALAKFLMTNVNSTFGSAA